MSGGYFNALCRESLFTPSPQLLDSCSSLLCCVILFFSFFLFQMTERITFRPRTTRTVRCKCLFLPSMCMCGVCVCVCSVLCLSASCLPPRPLSTHFLPHTQSDAWPRLYLQPPFLRNSLHFLHMTFCLGCSRPPSRPTSSSPLSSFSFSFA